MKQFGDIIRKMRLEREMTQEEFAKLLGTSKQVISRYESNQRTPKITVASGYAEKLGVSVDDLIPTNQNQFPNMIDADSVKNLVPIRTRRIPVLGQIAAGVPILTEENHEDFISVDDDIRCDAAVRVVGDSMVPTFLDGDFVLIRCQDDVDDGQIAAVIVDDSATLKHVYHIPNGVQLVSDNAKYRPMIYAGDEAAAVRIFGLAVAFQRRVEY